MACVFAVYSKEIEPRGFDGELISVCVPSEFVCGRRV